MQRIKDLGFGSLSVMTWIGGLTAILPAPASGGTYPFARYESLSGEIVRDIQQDADGTVWLATDNGVWVWDSTDFRFLVNGPSALKQSCCLLPDGPRRLWVGTFEGLYAIHPRTGEPAIASVLLKDRTVRAMVRDGDGVLWLGTDRGVHRLDPRGSSSAPLTTIPVAGTENWDVLSLAIDAQGSLWVGNIVNGLKRIAGDRIEARHTEWVGKSRVTALLETPDGALWIGLRLPGGLYRVLDHQVQRFGEGEGLTQPDVNSLCVGPDGVVWVGTEDGAFRFREGRFVRFARPEGLDNTDVHTVFIDREHQLWVGTFGAGAFRLPSTDIVTYGVNDGLPHPVVTGLGHGCDGALLVGTVAGAVRLDLNTGVTEVVGPHYQIAAMLCDPDGGLWFGGLYKTVRLVGPDSFDVPTRAMSIAADAEGGVLLDGATYVRRVDLSRDPRTAAVVDLSLSEMTPPIHAVHRRRDGSMLFAARSGLHQRRGEETSHLIEDLEVFAVNEGPDGTVWAGTAAGLEELGDAGRRSYVAPSAQAGGIRHVAIDARGQVWGGCYQGLMRVSEGRVDFFTLLDGLPSSRVLALAADTRGHLFVGTTRGMAWVDTARLEPREVPPRVSLDRVEAAGHDGLDLPDLLEVPGERRDVTLTVRCSGWFHTVGLRYQYRLSGHDEAWSAPDVSATRTYADLKPGRYIFQARAVTSRGLLSENVAEQAFQILPAYWETPRFRLLAGAAGLGVLGTIAALAVRRFRWSREREEMRRTLRARDEQFRAVCEATPVGIFFSDTSGECQYVNDRFQQISGMAAAQCHGWGWTRAIHEEDRGRVVGTLREAFRGRSPCGMEFRILTDSGNLRWVKLHSSPMSGPPEEGGVVGTLEDVSEQKRSEELLRESEERLKLAVRGGGEGVWDWDVCSNAVVYSEAWAELIGQPHAEIEPHIRSWEAVLHPDDHDRVFEAMQAHFDRLTPFYEAEYRVHTRSGEWKWVLARGQVVSRDADGKALRMTGIHREITARRQAEVRLRQAYQELDQRVQERTADLAAANQRLEQEVRERRRSEEAARRQGAEYQLLLDHVPAMIWFKDDRNTIIRANAAAVATAALSVGSIEGRSVYDLYPEEADAYYQDDLQVMRTGQSKLGIVEQITLAGGEKRWLRTDKIPYRDADGRIIGVVVFAVDITERKQAEEELVISEKRFRGAFETASAGMALAGTDGRWLKVNRALTQIVGFSEEELLARDFQSMTHPEDLPTDLQALSDFLEGRISTHYSEKRYVHKDGHPVWIQLSVALIRDRAHQPHYFVCLIQDIAARKRAEEERGQAEQALRESERRLATLIRNLPGMAYRGRNDPAWPLDFVSGGSTELTGFSPADFTVSKKLSYAEITHPDDRDYCWQEIQRALELRQPFKLEYRIRTREGAEKWVWEQGCGVWGEDGELQALEGIIIDISDRKRAEDLAQAHQAELAHAARLGVMGEMASEIAHEVNQPLTAILNYTQAWLRKLKPDARHPDNLLEDLESISKLADRAGSIIHGVRRFVRKGETRRSLADINDIVRDAAAIGKVDTNRHQVKLQTQLARRLPPVLVDAIQIEQVILNLMRNAVEAMAHMDPTSRELVIRTRLDNGHVEVVVTDTGAGLSPESTQRLFEPFFTTKPEGMGMGLAISRSIIDAHGGRLWAGPHPGRGTTFQFVLPIPKGGRSHEL